MKTDNIFWIQLDADRIIARRAIGKITWDSIEKKYWVLIDGTNYEYSRRDGRIILAALGIKP